MSIDAPRLSGRSPYGGPRPASDPPQPYTPLWRRLREDEWPPLGEVLRGRREQMPPGVLLVLLLPCLWWLTVPLLVCYQLARTARRMARWVFPVRPEGYVEDPEVLRVQRVRTWVALAMSGVLLAVFGGWQDVSEAQKQFLQRLLFAPWLALLSAAVVVALLFWAARPGTRRAMRTQLWPAGRSALWYFGAWTLVPLLFTAAGKGMSLLPSSANGLSGLLLWVSVMFVCWAPFWGDLLPLLRLRSGAAPRLQPVRPACGAARAGHLRPGLGVRLPRPVGGRSAAGPGLGTRSTESLRCACQPAKASAPCWHSCSLSWRMTPLPTGRLTGPSSGQW